MKKIIIAFLFFANFTCQNSHNKPNNSIGKRKLNQENKDVKKSKISNAQSNKHKPEKITTGEDLLATLTSKKATVLMGNMQGCHFCKMVKPIFEKHAKKYSNISFYIVNGLTSFLINDKKQNLAQIVYEKNNKIKIRGYPTFLFIKDGKIQDHLMGVNIEMLEDKIQSL